MIVMFTFTTFSIQGYFFGKSGEKLTARLRLETFKSMMRQVSDMSGS